MMHGGRDCLVCGSHQLPPFLDWLFDSHASHRPRAWSGWDLKSLPILSFIMMLTPATQLAALVGIELLQCQASDSYSLYPHTLIFSHTVYHLTLYRCWMDVHTAANLYCSDSQLPSLDTHPATKYLPQQDISGNPIFAHQFQGSSRPALYGPAKDRRSAGGNIISRASSHFCVKISLGKLRFPGGMVMWRREIGFLVSNHLSLLVIPSLIWRDHAGLMESFCSCLCGGLDRTSLSVMHLALGVPLRASIHDTAKN